MWYNYYMNFNTQQLDPEYEDLFVDMKVGKDVGITTVAVKNLTGELGVNLLYGYIFSNLNSSPKNTFHPSSITAGVYDPEKILNKIKKGREGGYTVTLRVISNNVITALLPIYAAAIRPGGIDVPDHNSEATAFIKVVDFFVDAGSLYGNN